MERSQDPQSYEFKIVLLGDRGVGKTCLVLRFIEGLYNARQQSTIGARRAEPYYS